MRILAVDDHNLCRKGFVHLLRICYPKAKIYEAANGLEALDLIRSVDLDLVLLDIQMPVMGGIELMKTVREFPRKPPVIVLTQYDERVLIIHMLNLGARGFLLKNCELTELTKAIESVLSNGVFYNAMTRQAIQENIGPVDVRSSLEISARELQVICLLKEGKTNKEIGTSLKLTARTIDSYRKSLMKKTGCHNVAEVVSLAYRTGLV